MKTSARGLKAIIQFEGFRSQAYLDPVGIPTIGYGFIEGVKMGDTITRAQADARLGRELAGYELAVMQATKGQVNQNQFDALVSLAWNIGKAGMAKSSVIKAHNRGDYQAAARAFGLWNKAGGKVLPGLTHRRAAEAAMYLETTGDQPDYSMPQKVDAEPSWTASPTNRAGMVAGGTAAVAAASETLTVVNTFKDSVSSLGDWLMPVLLGIAVIAIGVMLYQRWMMRKDGVA